MATTSPSLKWQDIDLDLNNVQRPQPLPDALRSAPPTPRPPRLPRLPRPLRSALTYAPISMRSPVILAWLTPRRGRHIPR